MNDIDFIKWMCEKAEGFEYQIYKYGEFVVATGIRINKTVIPNSDHWVDIYYPLLLQRAIEGVNKISDDFAIIQNHQHITVVEKYDYEYLLEIKDISDQAKESALKYIYEQEQL